MGVCGQCHPLPLYPWERETVSIVQEAGWAPGQVQLGAGNLADTGNCSPDCPARSELLYSPGIHHYQSSVKRIYVCVCVYIYIYYVR